jgi:hypothetical protein
MIKILTDADYEEQWEEWWQTGNAEESVYEGDREVLYKRHDKRLISQLLKFAL